MEMLKSLPEVGSIVEAEGKKGRVADVQALKQNVRVVLDDGSSIFVDGDKVKIVKKPNSL